MADRNMKARRADVAEGRERNRSGLNEANDLRRGEEHEPAKTCRVPDADVGGNFDLYREVEFRFLDHTTKQHPLNDRWRLNLANCSVDPLIGQEMAPYQVLR